MKNSKKFRLVSIILVVSILAFFSNDSSAQKSITPTNTTLAKKAMIKIAPDFNFRIIESNCYYGGVSLTIDIANPAAYTYLWKVNGGPGGHQMNQDCICGEYATVRVMRLKDGKQITRTIKLPSCGDENQ